MHHDKETPPAEPEAGAKTEKRVKDQRVILKGVQVTEGKKTVTISGDDPESLDRLESVMTPEMHKRLVENGSIEGNWQPKGTPAEPMQGSPLDKKSQGASARSGDGGEVLRQLEAENKALKAQISKAANEGDKYVKEYETRIKELEKENAALKKHK